MVIFIGNGTQMKDNYCLREYSIFICQQLAVLLQKLTVMVYLQMIYLRIKLNLTGSVYQEIYFRLLSDGNEN